MREEYDAHALVQRYELMIAEDDRYFFDLEAFEQIIDHYKALHRYTEALHATELALEQYPFAEELQFEKAQMLLYSNQLQEAKIAIQALENDYVVGSEVLILKATLAMRYGDYHESILILTEALPESTEKEELYYRIGYSHQQLQQYREAIKYYKKAIKLDFTLSHAVYEMLDCADTVGELEEAIAFFTAFTDAHPFEPYAWYNLGVAYTKLDDFTQALQALEYATLSQKDFAIAYQEMGHIYMNLAEYKQAQIHYTQALEYTDVIETYLLCCLGASYERIKDFESAIINYKEAFRMDRTSEEACFGIANCLFAQERWYETITYLRKLLHLNPEHEEYWLLLGDTEYQLGNTVGAVEAYEKSNAIFGQNPRLWLNWSWLYFEQGDLEQAFQIIEEGIEECRDDAFLCYRAVAYYISTGRFNESIDKLERAIDLDYDAHTILFDFFPEPEAQKTISRIIQQIKNNES